MYKIRSGKWVNYILLICRTGNMRNNVHSHIVLLVISHERLFLSALTSHIYKSMNALHSILTAWNIYIYIYILFLLIYRLICIIKFLLLLYQFHSYCKKTICFWCSTNYYSILNLLVLKTFFHMYSMIPLWD